MKVGLHKGQPVGWVRQVEGRGEAVPLIPHTDVAEIGPWLQQRSLDAHEDGHTALSSTCLLMTMHFSGKLLHRNNYWAAVLSPVMLRLPAGQFLGDAGLSMQTNSK